MAVDATTQAQLEGPILRWRVLCYADFDGDVLRATSGLYDMTISGSGDSELDGDYFSIDQDLIRVSEVQHSEGGADTVTISLSGLILGREYVEDRSGNFIFDRDGELISLRTSSLLNTIGDRTRWQGRSARLWFYCVDENESLVGGYIPYYTGFMDAISINGSPGEQTISLRIENYLVSISGASSKTYMMQELYDSGDTSAAATIAAANGLVDGVLSGVNSGGGGAWWSAPENAPSDRQQY